MSPRLKISNLAIERLKKLPECSAGQLLGVFDENSIFVLGICVTGDANNPEEENKEGGDLNTINYYDLIPNLPAGCITCGTYHILNDDASEEEVVNDEALNNFKEVQVVVNVNHASKTLSVQMYENEKLKKVEFDTITEKDISKLFVYLRLTATIPITCDAKFAHIQECFSNLQQKITAGNAAFHICNSNVYIVGNSSENITGVPPDSPIQKLISEIKADSETEIDVLNVNLYLKSSNNDMTPQLAPMIKYVKKTFKSLNIQLPLDSLSIVPRQSKVKDLYPVVVESVCRNLTLLEKSLLEQIKSGEVNDVSLPKVYHFLPLMCGHFLSIVYPTGQNLDQQKKFRETFHILLGLPLDRPLFRPGNAHSFSAKSEKNNGKLLLNPHEGLGDSGVLNGETCIVQGLYAYHHYMQDNFDDNGWGCAYRSLQTICSWFKLQGYTNMPVPTHKEIQQCLVNIGDKPSSFVGSKQWIGSTEVGFVLDSLLGVTCRIVRVSSGDELSMKGGELSYHFKTNGSPVMIGGGVLAHTILGVDYNKKTGAIKFLILDPHYTGSEDLNIIQSKGWCGWKGPEFWKKDAFYNMCMPLRPKCV